MSYLKITNKDVQDLYGRSHNVKIPVLKLIQIFCAISVNIPVEF
jgi:hypothetical protein